VLKHGGFAVDFAPVVAKHSTVVFAHRLHLGWRRPKPLLRLGAGSTGTEITHWPRSRSRTTRIVGFCAEGAPRMGLW
jgi:hypothetical protein